MGLQRHLLLLLIFNRHLKPTFSEAGLQNTPSAPAPGPHRSKTLPTPGLGEAEEKNIGQRRRQKSLASGRTAELLVPLRPHKHPIDCFSLLPCSGRWPTQPLSPIIPEPVKVNLKICTTWSGEKSLMPLIRLTFPNFLVSSNSFQGRFSASPPLHAPLCSVSDPPRRVLSLSLTSS